MEESLSEVWIYISLGEPSTPNETLKFPLNFRIFYFKDLYSFYTVQVLQVIFTGLIQFSRPVRRLNTRYIEPSLLIWSLLTLPKIKTPSIILRIPRPSSLFDPGKII